MNFSKLYIVLIRHIGKNTAKLLADNFDSLEKLQNASLFELASINEIGENSPIVLNKYFKEIHDRYNLSAILLFGDYDNDSTNGITSFYLKIILKIMYIIFPIIN